MRVKIVTMFRDDAADYSHADLGKGVYADVREHIAKQWEKNGWCVILPEEKKEEPEKPKESEPETLDRAIIETPEDHATATERETATVNRRGRHKRDQ